MSSNSLPRKLFGERVVGSILCHGLMIIDNGDPVDFARAKKARPHGESECGDEEGRRGGDCFEGVCGGKGGE